MPEEYHTAGLFIIRKRITAAGHAVDGSRIALAKAYATDVIRASQKVHEPPDHAAAPLDVMIRGGTGKGFRPVLVHHPLKLGRDFVHGLVPADAGPLAVASFSGSFQGV